MKVEEGKIRVESEYQISPWLQPGGTNGNNVPRLHLPPLHAVGDGDGGGKVMSSCVPRLKSGASLIPK